LLAFPPATQRKPHTATQPAARERKRSPGLCVTSELAQRVRAGQRHLRAAAAATSRAVGRDERLRLG